MVACLPQRGREGKGSNYYCLAVTKCTLGEEQYKKYVDVLPSLDHIARMFLQEERRLAEEADRARKEKAEKVVRRSAAEQAERNRLLGEYGYDSDPVDEDGNPLPPEDCGDGEGAAVRPLRAGDTSYLTTKHNSNLEDRSGSDFSLMIASLI